MSADLINQVLQSTLETIYMVLLSGSISVLFGLPLGVILLTTRTGGVLQNLLCNRGLSFVVNVVRAIPFVILLIALIPLTRLLVGTSIGTQAAIVPLTIGAIPFVARIVENALAEVNSGLIEAGHAMGTSPWQIIYKILLPEARPGIIQGITVTWISLVGYSAMAGAVGGGGLGSLAINYGYQRFNLTILLITIVVLIILVYGIQFLGDWLSRRFMH
ncbi:MAG TPA: methionine ABC transporter permease [Gammaproteobacteria bacterium]|nr:methionine ABC transporter permease [Gammaproteobacteria bacterium]